MTEEEKIYEIKEDGTREEIEGIQETRRLIGPNSYDDNYNLINYTSELRDNYGNFYAFVDFNEHGIGEVKYCPHCLEYELKHKLGPKIKKKGEPPAPDDNQFLSCYECGNTFPIYETHFESKIKDSVETTDNPFENESTFLITDIRATQRRNHQLRDRYRKGVTRYSSKRFKSKIKS